MAIGDNIKALREARGLKQIDVARHIGVDKSGYSKLERGQRAATVPELRGIAELLGTTMDDLAADALPDSAAATRELALAEESTARQVRLIHQLDDGDREALFRIVDRMLTSKRLRDVLADADAASTATRPPAYATP